MPTPRTFLTRLLNTPNFERIIPHLQPTLLERVIQTCGLEDCVDLVACATPQQISRVLDGDVWRKPRPDADEELDADRFGVWFEVLSQCGHRGAVDKLLGLDEHLVAAALSEHVAVFDCAVVSPFLSLDGEQVSAARTTSRQFEYDLAGYRLEAKRSRSWDAIIDMLGALESDNPEHFHRLMARCRRLSNGAREQDASHALLDDTEQNAFDLATARESRRERDGYVASAQARAFLQSARERSLTADRTYSTDPLTRAYFAALTDDGAGLATEPDAVAPLKESIGASRSQADFTDLGAVHAIFVEAGWTVSHRGALLPSRSGVDSARLGLVHRFIEIHGGADRAAYLANTLLAGCSVQGRPFTSQEASDAVLATCNLGLENWPPTWASQNLVTAFEVGWRILHHDVCLCAAAALADALTNLRCRDRAIHMQLTQLRLELSKHARKGVPWHARASVDVLVMLDAPAWAALTGLIAECPILHAALGASRQHARVVSPTSFEFVSENRQIDVIREFLQALPDTLA